MHSLLCADGKPGHDFSCIRMVRACRGVYSRKLFHVLYSHSILPFLGESWHTSRWVTLQKIPTLWFDPVLHLEFLRGPVKL